ncbi:MAG: DNA repair protein RecN [Bdellovibrionota bacterium]|nr:MAG: DNA repair protein RecN [Bdellovibrionota bacterium]
MLRALSIRNLAVIEKVDIEFAEGFSAITGETGAGKSVVLQAIELVIGRRASEHLIRSGAESLDVQAVFDLSSLPVPVRQSLPDIVAEGDELLVSRSVSRNGKSRVLLNGNLATVKVLEDVTSRIINLCGQNSQARLLEREYHRELLDDYAGNTLERARYEEAYARWREVSNRITTLRGAMASADKRREELEEIVKEIGGVKPRAGMRAELEREIRRHAGAENVLRIGQQLLAELGADATLWAGLRNVQNGLHELRRINEEFTEFEGRCRDLCTELRELESDLTRRLSSVCVDEESLEALRERLAELARLERKFKCDDAGLEDVLQNARQELDGLGGTEQLTELERAEEKWRAALESAARALSESRRKAGVTLAKAVRAELKDLAMPHAEIEVSLELAEYGPHGAESIEFLIATNKGETLKPLKLIASGGELARVTLVLKKLLRERSGINVLVFDEVDSGVSGRVARALGQKLRELAKLSQVICITHLPQVASLADQHFLVTKGGKDRVSSQIERLSDSARIEEIARMLAGYEVTPASRESARELLTSKIE